MEQHRCKGRSKRSKRIRRRSIIERREDEKRESMSAAAKREVMVGVRGSGEE